MTYTVPSMAMTTFTRPPSDWQDDEELWTGMAHHTCVWGTKVSE